MRFEAPWVLCAVAADDSAESVVATARRLREDGGYRIHCLHSADLPARTVPVYAGTSPGVPAYSRDLMFREATQAGEELFDRLGVRGDGFIAEIVHGDPVRELKARAEEIGPELIIAGSRGHGRITGALLGSVTRDLATVGRWPLLVVGEVAAERTRGPIVCGIAESTAHAVAIAEEASEFALRVGRPLLLAHVRQDGHVTSSIDVGGFPTAAGAVLPPPRPDSPDEQGLALLGDIEQRLGRSVYTRSRVLAGPPATALADLGEEVDAEAIVVGNRGLRGLRGTLDGSVSLELVRRTGRPVMIVPASRGVVSKYVSRARRRST